MASLTACRSRRKADPSPTRDSKRRGDRGSARNGLTTEDSDDDGDAGSNAGSEDAAEGVPGGWVDAAGDARLLGLRLAMRRLQRVSGEGDGWDEAWDAVRDDRGVRRDSADGCNSSPLVAAALVLGVVARRPASRGNFALIQALALAKIPRSVRLGAGPASVLALAGGGTAGPCQKTVCLDGVWEDFVSIAVAPLGCAFRAAGGATVPAMPVIYYKWFCARRWPLVLDGQRAQEL
jgi:hypothetical protein